MKADGQRKLFALILALLGLGLFVAVKFAPLPHRSTPASIFLLVLAAGIWFAAARVMPDPQRDEDDGRFARWAHGRFLLIFAATLVLLGYGLWAMFTGS
jgi:hypothetical protein